MLESLSKEIKALTMIVLIFLTFLNPNLTHSYNTSNIFSDTTYDEDKWDNNYGGDWVFTSNQYITCTSGSDLLCILPVKGVDPNIYDYGDSVDYIPPYPDISYSQYKVKTDICFHGNSEAGLIIRLRNECSNPRDYFYIRLDSSNSTISIIKVISGTSYPLYTENIGQSINMNEWYTLEVKAKRFGSNDYPINNCRIEVNLAKSGQLIKNFSHDLLEVNGLTSGKIALAYKTLRYNSVKFRNIHWDSYYKRIPKDWEENNISPEYNIERGSEFLGQNKWNFYGQYYPRVLELADGSLMAGYRGYRWYDVYWCYGTWFNFWDWGFYGMYSNTSSDGISWNNPGNYKKIEQTHTFSEHDGLDLHCIHLIRDPIDNIPLVTYIRDSTYTEGLMKKIQTQWKIEKYNSASNNWYNPQYQIAGTRVYAKPSTLWEPFLLSLSWGSNKRLLAFVTDCVDPNGTRHSNSNITVRQINYNSGSSCLQDSLNWSTPVIIARHAPDGGIACGMPEAIIANETNDYFDIFVVYEVRDYTGPHPGTGNICCKYFKYYKNNGFISVNPDQDEDLTVYNPDSFGGDGGDGAPYVIRLIDGRMMCSYGSFPNQCYSISEDNGETWGQKGRLHKSKNIDFTPFGSRSSDPYWGGILQHSNGKIYSFVRRFATPIEPADGIQFLRCVIRSVSPGFDNPENEGNEITETNIKAKYLPNLVFSVSPNPFSERLIINSNKPIVIYDLTGRIIRRIEAGKQIIKTKSWTNGIYIVSCGDKTKKIVKID